MATSARRLVMAGFNVGATYAYSVAVPALRDVLAGSTAVDGGQELAGQIDSYIEPMLEQRGDDSFDSGAGAVRADAAADVSGDVPATLVTEGVTPSDDSFGPETGVVRVDVSGDVPATLVAEGVTEAALERVPQTGPMHFEPRRNGIASQFATVDGLVRGGLDAPRLLDGRSFEMNAPLRYGNDWSTVTGPGLGASSPWVSLIPVVGPGAVALHDFGNGRCFWGSVNAVLALSDAAVGTSAIKGLYGGIKLGSHKWSAVRAWYRRTRSLDSGIDAHHWLIPRGGGGRSVPDWLKNQPWNLVPVPASVHRGGIHGNVPGVLNLQEFWSGTPTWFKAGSFSLPAHSLQRIRAREEVPTGWSVVEPALSPERLMEGPAGGPGR